MPELPEVEAVCRLFRRGLEGKRIVRATVRPDDIVLGATPPEAFVAAIEGRRLESVGRKGKYWWLQFDAAPVVFGHLGMSGWVRPVASAGAPWTRLHSHGKAQQEEEDGTPRFLKLMLEAEDGTRLAMTDGRRLARLWLGESVDADPRLRALGRDAYEDLPDAQELSAIFGRSSAPIKALLLAQDRITGIGNWIADEVLFQAGIFPGKRAKEMVPAEWSRLHTAITEVLAHAVEVEADYERFPADWLFHHRWGGGRGTTHLNGREIARETIGGRTTAWIPELQR